MADCWRRMMDTPMHPPSPPPRWPSLAVLRLAIDLLRTIDRICWSLDSSRRTMDTLILSLRPNWPAQAVLLASEESRHKISRTYCPLCSLIRMTNTLPVVPRMRVEHLAAAEE